jgi:peptidoglycan glycosyltransferase
MAQQPILYLAGALLLALALLVAVCGYWAVVRADELGARDDNPRRVLYEQRIVRGRILDRDGTVLADVEMADDGTVTRRYRVPEAAPAVGYASLRHGTGGIEATLDAELRGEAGRSAWQAVWQELLHRPPQGWDARLTLDAGLQVEAQRALEGHAGAVVLLDATSGEILALGSSPTFDPEALDEEWEALREDPAAPLVNRATQGLYQPGAALQTVVIAETLSKGLVDLSTPTTNSTATIVVNGTQVGCSTPLSRATTLGAAYAAGCPAPFAGLGEQLGAGNLEAAVERWGLTTPPSLEIPTVAADWDPAVISTEAALRAEATGQGGLTVSPLHMALVAATLANEGEMPAPRMVLQVRQPGGGWQESASAGTARSVLAPDEARALLAIWQNCGKDAAGHWGVAVAGEEQPPHAWFIGAAPRSGQKHYAIGVLIEHAESAETAVEIGTALLEAAASRAYPLGL